MMKSKGLNEFRKKLNKKVFDLLGEFGDDLSKKREVTHWFYFQNIEDLERFEQYAFDIGFKTMNKQEKKEEGKDLLLIIYKTETPKKDFIDFDTIDFWEKAEKFNGKYDGWETSIEME
jgi:regulator of RNase E activity RraB